MTAANILQAALGHMSDRAATYDKPDGERSIGATVDAFAAVTGVLMTEEQGWLFMSLLKAVRSQQGAYRADSYEDGAAYFALAGEAAARDRNGGWTAEEIKRSAFGHQNMIDPASVEISEQAGKCKGCHAGCFDCAPKSVEPASAIDPDDAEIGEAGGKWYSKVDLVTALYAASAEPASEIDDDSPRMQAIGQNGNDGVHYRVEQ